MADAIGQHKLYSCDGDGRVLYGTVTPSRMKKEASSKNWSSFFSTWKRSKDKPCKVSCTDESLFQVNSVQLDEYMMNHQLALLRSPQPGLLCHSLPVPSSSVPHHQHHNHHHHHQQQQQLAMASSSSPHYLLAHQQVHVNHLHQVSPVLYATGAPTVNQMPPPSRAQMYSHHTLAPVSCKKRGNLFTAQWNTSNKPCELPIDIVTAAPTSAPLKCTCVGSHSCNKDANVYLSRYTVNNGVHLPSESTESRRMKNTGSQKYYSTLGGGFMRSLKRSSEAIKSDTKSILTSPNATAYDLISHQLANCVSQYEDDALNVDCFALNGAPDDSESCDQVKTGPSSVASPYRLIPHSSTGKRSACKSSYSSTLSACRSRNGTVNKNNVRIGGQGVTLHSWEDTFLPSKLIASGNKSAPSSSSSSSPASASAGAAGGSGNLDSHDNGEESPKFGRAKRKESSGPGEASPSLTSKRGSNCQSAGLVSRGAQLCPPSASSYEKKVTASVSLSQCHQANVSDNLCEKLLVHLPEPDYDMSSSSSSSSSSSDEETCPLNSRSSSNSTNSTVKSEYKENKMHSKQSQKHPKTNSRYSANFSSHSEERHKHQQHQQQQQLNKSNNRYSDHFDSDAFTDENGKQLTTFKSILKNVTDSGDRLSFDSETSPPPPPPPPPPPACSASNQCQMSSSTGDKANGSTVNFKTRLSKLNKYTKHHRKYVTFHTEDKRILDHMTNEPIPEEDETLHEEIVECGDTHFTDDVHLEDTCASEKRQNECAVDQVTWTDVDNEKQAHSIIKRSAESGDESSACHYDSDNKSKESLYASNNPECEVDQVTLVPEKVNLHEKRRVEEEEAEEEESSSASSDRGEERRLSLGEKHSAEGDRAIRGHSTGRDNRQHSVQMRQQRCQLNVKHALQLIGQETDDKSQAKSTKKAPMVPPRSSDSTLSRSPVGSPPSPAPSVTRQLLPNMSAGDPATLTHDKSPLGTEAIKDDDKCRASRSSTLASNYRANDSSSASRVEDKNTSPAGDSQSKSDSSTDASEMHTAAKSSTQENKFRNMNKCQCSDKSDTQCQSTHQLSSHYESTNDAKSVQVHNNDNNDDTQSNKYDSLGEEIDSDEEILDTRVNHTLSETLGSESDQVNPVDSLEDEEEEEDDAEYKYVERSAISSQDNNMSADESDSSILRNGNKLKISLHYPSEKPRGEVEQVRRDAANATSKLFQKNRHSLNRRIGSSHVLQPIYKSSASSTSKSNKIIIDVPGSTSNYSNVSSSSTSPAATTTAVGHTSSPYIVSSSSSSTISSASSSSGYQGNTFDPYDCSSGSGHEEHIYEELYHIDNLDELSNDVKGIIDVSSVNDKCQVDSSNIDDKSISLASNSPLSKSQECKNENADKLTNLNLLLKSTLPMRTCKSHSYTSQVIKSMFDGASKDEILEYIEEAKERVKILSATSPLSGSSVSSLHLTTTFTNSLDRAFYSESASEEYLHSLAPLTVNQSNFLSSASAVNLSSGINSSTISSTSSANSGSSSGNSSDSSPYTRTKSTPCIVSAVATSTSLLPSLGCNTIHSSSGSSIAGDLPPVKGKATIKEPRDAPVTAPPRRNRSSNVSNSSTDSAVTTGSSNCDHDIDGNYCISGQMILSPPAQFTSAIDSQGMSNLPRSISLSHLIERQDSGVGPETCKPNRLRRALSGQSNLNPFRCVDCDEISSSATVTLEHIQLGLCVSCEKKRTERKEIISEFVDTEFKYGRDLRIIKEEVYSPIEVAGLMTKDQLKSVFINLDQLITVNRRFAHLLEDSLDTAYESGDEDYANMNLGKVFLEEASTMLSAFEMYCCNQGSASLILTQLEKEKELLRIFLKVSQMENPLLRRMNLSAFLMVPVQRVTKYPLLLSRLLKVTPVHHPDYDALKQSQARVEWHLDHINQQTKSTAQNKIWKRISNLSVSQRRLTNLENNSNIKLRKIALEALKWSRDEASFVLSGKLLYTSYSESMTSRKGRTSKFINVHALLVILGKPTEYYRPDLINCPDSSDHESFNASRNKTGISDAALVLIREKNSRYTLSREPFDLKKCIVSATAECEEEAFEIQELMAKDFFLFKAEMNGLTCQWFKQLSYHARDLGSWRQRRNALPNIMMSSR